jgi:hypothetical protein
MGKLCGHLAVNQSIKPKHTGRDSTIMQRGTIFQFLIVNETANERKF